MTTTTAATTMSARYLSVYGEPTVTTIVINGQTEVLWAVVLGANVARIRTSVTGWQTVGLDDEFTVTIDDAVEFGATPAYRIGQRVEALGVGGVIIAGTVKETKGGLFRDELVNVEWDHLGHTNWETTADLRPVEGQWTTHSVVVYLNGSRDASFGFDNDFSPAELRQAAEFTVRTWAKDPTSYVLNGVFEQLNVGGELIEATDYTKAYRAAGNRSLSVGDVVIVDNQAYAVGRVGFDEITMLEVFNAAHR